DQVRSLCVSSQRRACIDSRTLSTTVASPCQTLRELLAGETHTDSPAHQLAVWRMRSSPRVCTLVQEVIRAVTTSSVHCCSGCLCGWQYLPAAGQVSRLPRHSSNPLPSHKDLATLSENVPDVERKTPDPSHDTTATQQDSSTTYQGTPLTQQDILDTTQITSRRRRRSRSVSQPFIRHVRQSLKGAQEVYHEIDRYLKATDKKGSSGDQRQKEHSRNDWKRQTV
ncbi:hypothetical protein GBAR_LOCUS3247, partial [Geodia barretti]